MSCLTELVEGVVSKLRSAMPKLYASSWMDTVCSGAMAFVATATDDIRVSELRQSLGKTAQTGIYSPMEME